MNKLVGAVAIGTALLVACSGSSSPPGPTSTPAQPATPTPQLQSPQGHQELEALGAALNDGSATVVTAACSHMVETLYGAPVAPARRADGDLLTLQICAPALNDQLDNAKTAFSRLKAENP